MRSDAYEQAAYALASGEISDVIEADGEILYPALRERLR